MDNASAIATMVKFNRKLNLNSGMLVTCPIPDEFSADSEEIRKAIDVALLSAKEQNISGKDITPFLLERINTLTGGRSLEANIQLVLNNARVGADIARELLLQENE